MNKYKVISKNQQGGITAGEIYINTNLQKLVLIQDEDKNNNGHWKKNLIFGSENNIGLNNIRFTIKFDSNFNSVSSAIVGNGIVTRGTFKEQISEDKKIYLHNESILNPNNYIQIQFTSAEKLKILEIK